MQSGDIVLVHGSGPPSRLIQWAQRIRGLGEDSRWTHVAIAVSDTDIVEAVFHGVRHRAFPDSAIDTRPYEVASLPISPDDRREMADFALSCVGEEYGVLSIACIALALWTGGALVIGENKHSICSQLVGRALERAGVIWDRDTSELTPADIAVYCHERTTSVFDSR